MWIAVAPHLWKSLSASLRTEPPGQGFPRLPFMNRFLVVVVVVVPGDGQAGNSPPWPRGLFLTQKGKALFKSPDRRVNGKYTGKPVIRLARPRQDAVHLSPHVTLAAVEPFQTLRPAAWVRGGGPSHQEDASSRLASCVSAPGPQAACPLRVEAGFGGKKMHLHGGQAQVGLRWRIRGTRSSFWRYYVTMLALFICIL